MGLGCVQGLSDSDFDGVLPGVILYVRFLFKIIVPGSQKPVDMTSTGYRLFLFP